MNKKGQLEWMGIATLVAGLLKTNGFLIFLGIAIFLYFSVGFSWISGFPLWIIFIIAGIIAWIAFKK
jgi:hypothetical protein